MRATARIDPRVKPAVLVAVLIEGHQRVEIFRRRLLAEGALRKAGENLPGAWGFFFFRRWRTEENAVPAGRVPEARRIEWAADHNIRNNRTGRVDMPEIVRARRTLPNIGRAHRLRSGLYLYARFQRRTGGDLDSLAVQRQLKLFSLDPDAADPNPAAARPNLEIVFGVQRKVVVNQNAAART